MSTPPEDTVPVSLFSGLVPKLAAILELTQNTEGTSTPEARQALVQTTADFKNALKQARELASALPGGEMQIEEQNEVIAMLEALRDSKRQQMEMFAQRAIKSSSSFVPTNPGDSMASTPGP